MRLAIVTRPTALIVAIAGVALIAGCTTSWDAEYARGRQDGYRAAVDSVRSCPVALEVGVLALLRAQGLQYTIDVQSDGKTVAEIHGGIVRLAAMSWGDSIYPPRAAHSRWGGVDSLDGRGLR